MTGYYVHNLETMKLELHFDKEDYAALSDAQKASIKGAFLWGSRSGCWISRCKEPNLYRAINVAKTLGLEDQGRTGERLSFAEQQDRKSNRAERRVERYEEKAERAAERGDQLQKPIIDMHGDTAFFTQPNINTSAGRAFKRKRERMFAAFEKGFEAFNQSAYYRDRAATARKTADREELKDKGFINRRIRDCESNLRRLKKYIESWEKDELPRAQAGELKHWTGEPFTEEEARRQLDTWGEQMEAELDKLGYYQDAMDALGGVKFSKANVSVGDIVKVKCYPNAIVVAAGPKYITYRVMAGGVWFTLKASYAEIDSVVCKAQDDERVKKAVEDLDKLFLT